jgi:DNA-binding transcriptional LysR family regulator
VARRTWVFTLLALLAACQASPTPIPTPGELEVVLVSPSLLPQTSGWLQDYHDETGMVALSLHPMPYPSAIEMLQDISSGAYITSQSPPEDWWASPLGSEPIAVVVHPSNPLRQLSHSELIQILSGQVSDWGDWTEESAPIEVIFPLPGDETRIRFMDLLAPGLALVPDARLASSPTMLAELVAEAPGRIGILPYSLVGADLKVLRIDGLLPDDEDYPFSIDLVATAPQEPQGPIRAWLVWVQANLGLSQAGSPEPQATQTMEDTLIPSSPTPDTGGTSTPPPTRTPSASQNEE